MVEAETLDITKFQLCIEYYRSIKFDCPCHGSRFTTTGEIIEGPAVDDLKEIDYTDGES